jgi:hypothetical protein
VTSALVSAVPVTVKQITTPGGRTRVPVDAPRRAVELLASRPHLTARRRPRVKCCPTCKNAPLYNPDAAAAPPAWFADGLDMAARWNA